MPIHDWTRVDPGVFHDFHLAWIAEIRRSLNGGLLPRGYYALAEQVMGDFGPDVLALRRPISGSLSADSEPPGGIAVLEAPPKVRFRAQAEMDRYAAKARRVVIRHRSRHQIIAIIENVSPGNKNGQTEFAAFVHKATQALLSGIHLLIVDLFPPTSRDPDGIHRVIWDREGDGDFALPDEKPLTCVSYVGYPGMEVFLDPVAVGDPLPDMPCSSPARSMCRFRWRPPTRQRGRVCRTSCRTCSPRPPRMAARSPVAAASGRNDPCRVDRRTKR